jgi:hypothetical protein
MLVGGTYVSSRLEMCVLLRQNRNRRTWSNGPTPEVQTRESSRSSPIKSRLPWRVAILRNPTQLSQCNRSFRRNLIGPPRHLDYFNQDDIAPHPPACKPGVLARRDRPSLGGSRSQIRSPIQFSEHRSLTTDARLPQSGANARGWRRHPVSGWQLVCTVSL